jgi:uncharacterized membrane protein
MLLLKGIINSSNRAVGFIKLSFIGTGFGQHKEVNNSGSYIGLILCVISHVVVCCFIFQRLSFRVQRFKV